MLMIEVFKTNVQLSEDANQIVNNLHNEIADSKINFDLEDCDKILRIEGTNNSKNNYIIKYLNQLGFNCEVLE